TMPKGVMREVVTAAMATGWTPPSAGVWGIVPDAFGSVARRPSFVVDVGDWVPPKVAALACHRTQMGANNPLARIGEADARRWLGIEQFRRARPHTGDSFLETLADPVASANVRRRASLNPRTPMQISTLDVLRCPYCGGRFELVSSLFHRSSADDIHDGILGCHCCIFPVVSGIPVLHL